MDTHKIRKDITCDYIGTSVFVTTSEPIVSTTSNSLLARINDFVGLDILAVKLRSIFKVRLKRMRLVYEGNSRRYC